MKLSGIGLGMVGVMILSSACAQEVGRWKAASKTAQAITGDIELSKQKLSINFASYPIAAIRELSAAELSGTFNADDVSGASGSLYRLSVPGAQKFLHKNSLCGGEDTEWMVTFSSGKTLQVAFFSGAKMPVLTAEAMTNTTELCGTYSYVR